MRGPRSVVVAVAITVLGFGLSIPGPATASDDALLAGLDMGYVEEITTHLTTIGSTADGFRVFGTPQDKETATYLSGQMKTLGLSNVAVEKMRGDGWLFEGGSVGVAGPGLKATFKAASLGGVPGTGRRPLSGEVVSVGYGTAPEYEGLDVRGKIVFAWWDFDSRGIWPNLIAEEAKAHGAKAAVIASGPGHIWYQAGGGAALGSNDGECSLTLCAPLVTISKRDANALMAALARGTVNASVTLKATNKLGATGYQAIGQITGAVHPEKVIVFTAHHDAWFTSAADDSVGVAMMMAVAKAVKDSGYRPAYTWVFAPVTGEEYGLADTYADWLQGAYHRITTSHTEWQRDAVAVLNWELHSPPYNIHVATSLETQGVVGDSLTQSKTSGMIGNFTLGDVFSWNDGFVYQALGAPSMTFSASGLDYWQRYHTDYDSLDTLDFPSLKPVLAAEAAIALELDRPVQPYGFDPRLADLAARLDTATMEQFGADAAGVWAAYDELAAAWARVSGASYSVCAVEAIRAAVRETEADLTALYLGEGTAYPYEQAQLDLENLDATAASLQAGRWENALASLRRVSLNSTVFETSRSTYDHEFVVRDSSYPKVSWAIQGQYPPLLNLYDLSYAIRAKGERRSTSFGPEVAEIERLIADQSVVYQNRIESLAGTLRSVALKLDAVDVC